MTQQLLHRANVITIFEQMRCKRVTQSMTIHLLVYAGYSRCFLDTLLQTVFVQVMPASRT